MSESQNRDRTRELGELFVSVTGDDTVTESQEEDGEKVSESEDDEYAVGDDGLDGAIDADLDGASN
ncbi:hypothetical protein I7X12_07130 [Halosimplex litoreum]|uniref:Uncharacterized protein n=1 Tax=Halosimplex litoreum TaxID=1198301 RepID=A0A7T3KWS3_9EURY|nr:hypothetical protein [Halosimplex litoreum]QPV64378.1 hypothetical protein I7X12_07130 [Halosimplex litoreum]